MKKLYVFRAENGAAKIGISENPDQRLRDLSGAHASQLSCVYETAQAYPDALQIERSVHKALACKRVKREWFACSDDEAIAAIERAVLCRVPPPAPPPAPIDLIAPIIARVRRAMPRNKDVLAICDHCEKIERKATLKTDRKRYFREYMQRYRRDKKGQAS